MDFPIQIKPTRMGLSIIYFKGAQDGILYLKIVLTSTESVDPDELQHSGYSLPKYPFKGFQYMNGLTKGLEITKFDTVPTKEQ